jgi:Mlc titration factor MtfA (ptsG expression regulator)
MLYGLFIFIVILLMIPLIRWGKARIVLFFSDGEEVDGRMVPEISNSALEIFLSRMPYYQPLSVAAKARFRQRTLDFIGSKQFIGAEGLAITDEMKVLVSALAVQLTFGLQNYFISFFHTIRLYPSTFYSRMAGARLKGGTSESGLIQLSWADLVSGVDNPGDKINLGLHELAHALEIGVMKGSDFDQTFASYYEFWQDQADSEFTRMHAGEKSFLRAYGGTNEHEFFAVCVEHFFEAPQEFNSRLPQIYLHLTILLNQDPLRPRFDYSREYNLVDTGLDNKIKMSFKYSSWHWSLTVLLLGIFVGPMALMYTTSLVTNPDYNFVLLYFTIVGLGAYPQYKYLVGREALNGVQFTAYLLLGFGLLATSSLLLLNSFGGFGTRTEMCRMTGSYTYHGYQVKINLEKNAYSENGNATCVDISNWQKIRAGNYLDITFKKGILGAESFNSNCIIEMQPRIRITISD